MRPRQIHLNLGALPMIKNPLINKVCALMMIVLLIWSLCELLISPPYMLGDEAPYKTEALIDGLRTQRQVTCSEPAHPVLSTRVDGGVVAPLFDSISTNDQ